MKVTRIDTKRTFPTFDITLTIESQEEARALYALFNKGIHQKMLGKPICENILAEIGNQFYVGTTTEVIANGVTYQNFYLD